MSFQRLGNAASLTVLSLVAMALVGCGGPTDESSATEDKVLTQSEVSPYLWQPPLEENSDAQGNALYVKVTSAGSSNQNEEIIASGGSGDVKVTQADGILSIWLNGKPIWSGSPDSLKSGQQLSLGLNNTNSPVSGIRSSEFSSSSPFSTSAVGLVPTCNSLSGWMIVDNLQYDGRGNINALMARFRQTCGDGSYVMVGGVRWTQNGAEMPYPPAGLWYPNPAMIPANGSYAYFSTDDGHSVGAAGQTLLTKSNATWDVKRYTDTSLRIVLTGDTTWTGVLGSPSSDAKITPGMYRVLSGFSLPETDKAVVYWSHDHRGCSTGEGWLDIDHVVYVGSAITEFDARFEHHCAGLQSAPALRGAIHWVADDGMEPAGPVNPVPDSVWQPHAGDVPTSGNYLLVDVDNDSGGILTEAPASGIRVYTHGNSAMTLNEDQQELSLSVRGTANWTGHFLGMSHLASLTPGWYQDLSPIGYHNPTRGGLDWIYNSSRCLPADGWFAVDRIERNPDGSLSGVDLRFEYTCPGLRPWTIRGALHWDASTVYFPAPELPIPSDLWRATPASLPTSGNYFYSQNGDNVGEARIYGDDNALFSVKKGPTKRSITLQILPDASDSLVEFGEIAAMESLTELEEGYYGELGNPARGSMIWNQGCVALIGGDPSLPGRQLCISGNLPEISSAWMAVDRIEWDGETVKALDLRFERRIDPGAIPHRVQIHWVAPAASSSTSGGSGLGTIPLPGVEPDIDPVTDYGKLN